MATGSGRRFASARTMRFKSSMARSIPRCIAWRAGVWLASEWKMSEASRRAKYYKLTPKGKKQMLEEQAKWKQLVRVIARTTKPIES